MRALLFSWFVALALLAVVACDDHKHDSHDHTGHEGHDHENHKHERRHAGRHTRHAHHNWEDFARKHLAWMSADELADVKSEYTKSKHGGRERMLAALEATQGETRVAALSSMQDACRELLTDVLGTDKALILRDLKQAKEPGHKIMAKLDELLEGVSDDTKKAKGLEYRDTCEKIYATASREATGRRRRDHSHHHGLESKLKSEWSWLTDAQKDELRTLKGGNANDAALLSKVFEFFKSADNKAAAEDGLQTSCGNAVLKILGADKAEQLKAFMANGAAPAAYEAKVKELLEAADSSTPASALSANEQECRRIFVAPSSGHSHARRRRDQHTHPTLTLEGSFSTHLAWLTDGQKETLRTLKQEGKPEEVLQAEVINYYESATGETKTRATAALQGACREVLESVIGHDAYGEIAKLKESGASAAEMGAKIDTLVKAVTDEEKLKRGRKYESHCKKLFGVTA